MYEKQENNKITFQNSRRCVNLYRNSFSATTLLSNFLHPISHKSAAYDAMIQIFKGIFLIHSNLHEMFKYECIYNEDIVDFERSHKKYDHW